MTIQSAKLLLENLITTGRADDAATIKALVERVRGLSGHLMNKGHSHDCPLGPRDPDAQCTCGIEMARASYKEVMSALPAEPIDEAISLVFGGEEEAKAESVQTVRRLSRADAMERTLTSVAQMNESAGTDVSVQIDRDLSSVTRVEVIDDSGRAYTKYGVKAEISMQDSNRTMKVFLSKR